jgi:hypothetical protein
MIEKTIMRLSQTQLGNAVSQTQSEERVGTQSVESTKAEISALTADAINNTPLRSANLERAIHKISSRRKPAFSTQILSIQAQSISGTRLKVGAEARPYLRLFLANVAPDKSHK